MIDKCFGNLTVILRRTRVLYYCYNKHSNRINISNIVFGEEVISHSMIKDAIYEADESTVHACPICSFQSSMENKITGILLGWDLNPRPLSIYCCVV